MPAPARSKPARWGGILFAFLIDLLGYAAFFMIIGVAAYLAWLRYHPGM